MRLNNQDDYQLLYQTAVLNNPGINFPPYWDYNFVDAVFEGGQESVTYDQPGTINVTMAGATEFTPVLNFKCKRRNISTLTDLLANLDIGPWIDDPELLSSSDAIAMVIEHINAYLGVAIQTRHLEQMPTFNYNAGTGVLTIELKADRLNLIWYGSQTLQLKIVNCKGILTLGNGDGWIGYNDSVGNQPSNIQVMGAITNADSLRPQIAWYDFKPKVKSILWGNGADFSTQRFIDVVMETTNHYSFPNEITIGGCHATVVDYSPPTKLAVNRFKKRYSFDTQLPLGNAGDALSVVLSRLSYNDSRP